MAVNHKTSKLWSLLLVKIPAKIGSVARRFKYRLIFGTTAVKIGHSAKLIGLNRVTLEGSFEAGNYLWLEAIESFAGDVHCPTLIIGKNFNCSDFVHVGCINEVRIGENVLVGSKSIITDHSHGRYQGQCQSEPTEPPYSRSLYSKASVVIGDNVFIGDNCVVQSGAVIGHGCVIAAGSVVLGTIPDNCIAAGVPAKVLRMFEKHTGEWARPR